MKIKNTADVPATEQDRILTGKEKESEPAEQSTEPAGQMTESAEQSTVSADQTAGSKKTFAQRAAHAAAKTAVLSALGCVLYILRFPIPFLFPSFLDFQISDLPAILGGFSMGPVAGCVIILIKCGLKALVNGSSFGGIGDLADIIIGCSFVLVSSIIYRKHKTKKRALVGLALGSVTAIAAAVVINRFLLVPLMGELYGWEAIIGMTSTLFPNVTQSNFYSYYIPLAVIPFNALRCLGTGAVTFLIYKRLSAILHW